MMTADIKIIRRDRDKRDTLRYESVKARRKTDGEKTGEDMNERMASKSQNNAPSAFSPTDKAVTGVRIAADSGDKSATVTDNIGDNRPIAQLSDDNGDVVIDKEAVRKAKKRRRRRRRIHEISYENDIRYRGPLSYRHLKSIAWLLIAFSQIGVFLSIGINFDPQTYGDFKVLDSLCSTALNIALTVFILANFAIILSAKDGYLKAFLRFGAGTLAIAATYFLVCDRYLVGLIDIGVKDRELSKTAFETVFYLTLRYGYFSFNVFLDLLLCLSVTYFLNYRPKRLFKGKKVIVFRLFSLIPIAYEVISNALKILASNGTITLSYYVFPFLTTKPPMVFVVFTLLAFFIKRRERFFIKRGKTHDDYQRFLGTKVNSLHFSVVTAITFFLAAIIDFVMMFVLSFVNLGDGLYAENSGELFVASFQTVSEGWNIGGGVTLLALVPVVMLFSYNKKYKPGSIDVAIPIVGAALVVLVYLEGGFQVISALPDAIKSFFSA